jgi:tetratricopeptide (TPR) repeat protein
MNLDASDKSKVDKLTDMLLAGRMDEARQLSASIQDEDYRDWTLGDLVKSMLNAGAVDRAAAIAEFMAPSYYKADSLRAIARQLATMGDLKGAWSILEKADNIPVGSEAASALESDIAPDKASDLYDIADLFLKAGDTERARALRARAVQVAQSGEASSNTQHSRDSSKVLHNFVRRLAAAGEIDQARAIAQSIANPIERDDAIDTLAEVTDGG